MSSLPLRVNDDTDAKAFYYFTDTVWSLTGSGVPDKIEDANGNTRVQTEKFPDQDIIRFDLDGTEEMVLPKNANGQGRLEFPDAQKNTFIGDNAGESAITGIHNVALCFDALGNNTYGNFNTAIGFDAIRSNTSGWGNVAMGKGAPSGCRLKPGCKGHSTPAQG